MEYLELVEGSFTQEHLDKQKSQIPYVAYSIKDGKVIYNQPNIIEVITLGKKDISNIVYNKVDLGIKTNDGKTLYFADKNIGANKPENIGSFFAWGETNIFVNEIGLKKHKENNLIQKLIDCGITTSTDSAKTILTSQLNYGSYVVQDKLFSKNDYKFTYDTQFSKYNNIDNKSTLDLEDDAAHVILGSNWRIPTMDEINLVLHNNSITREYVTENDVIVGAKLTSTITNESLYLPFTGFCYDPFYQLDIARYWTSSIGSDKDKATSFIINEGNLYNSNSWERWYGLPIRPVWIE